MDFFLLLYTGGVQDFWYTNASILPEM